MKLAEIVDYAVRVEINPYFALFWPLLVIIRTADLRGLQPELKNSSDLKEYVFRVRRFSPQHQLIYSYCCSKSRN